MDSYKDDSSEIPPETSAKPAAHSSAVFRDTAHAVDTMSPQAAATYLGVEVTTLAMWRSTKRYPLPYIKVGRLVQYRKSHLDAFLMLRTVELAP